MLRLRQLRLRAITNHATFGADLPFAEGLNVLRAGNTSGKSTCLQAVLFALGLERSLGPRLDIPLPYAMRERIQEWKNGPYQTVLQSFVELEIENDRQQVVTVRRDVVGGTNPKLVRTWMGAQLSAPDPNAQQRDFFVFDAGASQREDGFHSFLARFLGWSLPEVTCFDGSDSPLYLETIFPMFFVEQKRGWSAIQGPLPTYFGIQDLVRRVMEFILDLDAGRIRRERADLRRSIDLIERDWAAKLAEVEDRASHSLHFKGIPRVPTAEFVQSPTIELEVFEQGEWLSVAEVITATRTLISDLEAADVPTTEQASPEVERELNVARDGAAEIAALIETIHQELTSQVAEKREIERRLSSLEADMARNQDAQKLKKLGSNLGFASSDHRCPTCHQDVTAELLPAGASVTMALDENISFLKSQIDLYRSTQRSLQLALERSHASYQALNAELRDQHRRIRELREALVQPSSSPSRARIEDIVRLQGKLDRLTSLQQMVDSTTDELWVLAKKWADTKARLKELSGSDFSSEDREKMGDFEASVQRQLELYGFGSFHADEIHLSEDNFRPIVRTRDEGSDEIVEKELGFEVSASDGIRLKWAYYLSLLALSKARTTNHAGLVIFDEPGQHQMETDSFEALLRWASTHLGSQQQAIVATSESLATVRGAIASHMANVINIEGFILKPVE